MVEIYKHFQIYDEKTVPPVFNVHHVHNRDQAGSTIINLYQEFLVTVLGVPKQIRFTFAQ